MNQENRKSGPFHLKVWGRNACFTRPEMKVERVSYDVMTPSAARGILEAILWKPAISWKVAQIDVLQPIRWESVRRNEVGTIMSADLAITAMNRGSGKLGFYVEEHRQQRAGLILRDVAYVIHAQFMLTDQAGPQDSVVKFQEMFLRRAEKGQCFHRPYLGCREFAAHFQPIRLGETLPEPVAETRSLGWMLLDLDYNAPSITPLFFKAELVQGRLAVPAPDDKGVKA